MRLLMLAFALMASPVAAQTSRVTAVPVAADSAIIKAGTSYLSGVNVTSGATAGYVMIFDAATVPADGTVSPRKCLPLAANTGIQLSWTASPLYFQNGAVVVFSSTGCFTKTASATAFISGDIQ